MNLNPLEVDVPAVVTLTDASLPAASVVVVAVAPVIDAEVP